MPISPGHHYEVPLPRTGNPYPAWTIDRKSGAWIAAPRRARKVQYPAWTTDQKGGARIATPRRARKVQYPAWTTDQKGGAWIAAPRRARKVQSQNNNLTQL
ncbi:hypothetical protein ABID19_006689 [Mesorhizobium robiniae]|uniref:Uncharacterized protein n=1 Tax=Mesorhizobium robiniae TaxID=559315 RepID=A0ABV2GZB4_9HYPH